MKNDRIITLLDGIANGLMISVGIPALINILTLWYPILELNILADQMNLITNILIAIGVCLAFKDSVMVTFSNVLLGLYFMGSELYYSSVIFILLLVIVRLLLVRIERTISPHQWLLPLVALVIGYLVISVIAVPINSILISFVEIVTRLIQTSLLSLLLISLMLLSMYYTPLFLVAIMMMSTHVDTVSSHWLALLAMMTSTVYLSSKSNGYTKSIFMGYFSPWHITKLYLRNFYVLLISLTCAITTFVLNHYIFDIKFTSSGLLPIYSLFLSIKDGLSESTLLIVLLSIALPIVISHVVYYGLSRHNKQNVKISTI